MVSTTPQQRSKVGVKITALSFIFMILFANAYLVLAMVGRLSEFPYINQLLIASMLGALLGGMMMLLERIWQALN